VRVTEDDGADRTRGHVDLGFDRDVVGGAEPEAFHRAQSTVVRVEDDDKQPIKMLNDRLLVQIPQNEGERRSRSGILIPATAQVSKRLAWAEVVAVGPNVRTVEAGDQVLFNPEDRFEVEVRGDDYIILRERDVHAVASPRIEGGSTGLYL
jgi:chaperonin GroES